MKYQKNNLFKKKKSEKRLKIEKLEYKNIKLKKIKNPKKAHLKEYLCTNERIVI